MSELMIYLLFFLVGVGIYDVQSRLKKLEKKIDSLNGQEEFVED